MRRIVIDNRVDPRGHSRAKIEIRDENTAMIVLIDGLRTLMSEALKRSKGDETKCIAVCEISIHAEDCDHE